MGKKNKSLFQKYQLEHSSDDFPLNYKEFRALQMRQKQMENVDKSMTYSRLKCKLDCIRNNRKRKHGWVKISTKVENPSFYSKFINLF